MNKHPDNAINHATNIEAILLDYKKKKPRN